MKQIQHNVCIVHNIQLPSLPQSVKSYVAMQIHLERLK